MKTQCSQRKKKKDSEDFPDGAVVKTLHFQCRGTSSIPGGETKIPHVVVQKKKKKRFFLGQKKLEALLRV